MSINCDCSYDDGESPAVFREITIKARKQHRCCECGDTIQKGEMHELVDGCWEGRWDHYRTCSFCATLRKTYCPHGFVYGELAEQISECLGFWYPTDPAEWEPEDREPEPWQLRERDEERRKKGAKA